MRRGPWQKSGVCPSEAGAAVVPVVQNLCVPEGLERRGTVPTLSVYRVPVEGPVRNQRRGASLAERPELIAQKRG